VEPCDALIDDRSAGKERAHKLRRIDNTRLREMQSFVTPFDPAVRQGALRQQFLLPLAFLLVYGMVNDAAGREQVSAKFR